MNHERNAVSAHDLRAAIHAIALLMEQNREWLCQLDGDLGDGDLGLTMSAGFLAVAGGLDKLEVSDVGLQLDAAADIMGDTVASTMGTLLAAGFAEAARSCRGKQALSLPDLGAVAQGIADGVARRGKARPGQKTILDALQPAADALHRAAAEGTSIAIGLQRARAAAERGARESAALQARHGRAARYLEKSKGKPDPGAVAGSLIYEGLASLAGTAGGQPSTQAPSSSSA